METQYITSGKQICAMCDLVSFRPWLFSIGLIILVGIICFVLAFVLSKYPNILNSKEDKQKWK